LTNLAAATMAARKSGKSGNGPPPPATGGSAGASSEPISALEERLGHRFADPTLLKRALTHASAGNESNERLEFLGDRVLGLIVAARLYADYPGESEGGLAVRLNALVRGETCARIADAVGLAPHLIMATAESGSGGRQKNAILAGACEAIIAALYLDGGLAAATCFVLRYWNEAFATLAPELRDAKTALQEWAQSGVLTKRVQPTYAVVDRFGPDHAPMFTVEVSVPAQEPQRGEGSTKREAEQEAARRMLVTLGVWKE
jgi:ribonuclease III